MPLYNPAASTSAATTSAAGIVELATNAEARTGTDTDRAVTAAAMIYALGAPIYTTKTVDFGSVSANSQLTTTTTVTGLTSAHTIILTPQTAPEAGIAFDGYCVSADQLTVRCRNGSSGSVNPASIVLNVLACARA
jgi:hypothetical protein